MRTARAHLLPALLASLVMACGTGDAGHGDAGAGADAGPTVDAFDLPDTINTLFSIQFIDPIYGPFSGGTEVMVRGNGFQAGATVFFGGRMVEPLDVQFIDSRRLTIRTPPGNPGLADVDVQVGSDIATLEDAFTYEAIELDPKSGAVAGGTYVQIAGFGTNWDTTTQVTFDGLPMTSLTVLNDQLITGWTPPGTAGTADIRVTTGTVIEEAQRAFTYLATVDPFAGGMGGGPINGSLNVVVIDSNTGNGIDNAFVAVGDPTTTTLKGRADDLGQITFSEPGLVGPVTVTAAADTYETAVFVQFDARDITIFLRKPPEPFPGPIPPGPQNGRIEGHVLFGEAVGIGSPHWHLVPEPRTPTERKRVYVVTTGRNMFSTPFTPTNFIDYEYDPDVVAWEWDTWVRPSAVSVVAIAGLYDSAKDPSGTGVTGFEPYALGIKRGVLVGAGETVQNVDIIVNIPLDTALQVDLDRPPLLGEFPWSGPIQYTLRPFVDLGGEGVIGMNKPGMPLPPAPELAPNIFDFAPNQQSILLSAMAPLTKNLADASYGFIVGAYSQNGGNPFSVRIVRGLSNVSLPFTIGDFIPMPRPEDPPPGGLASRMHLELVSSGDSTGTATFNMHVLASSTGDMVMRMFVRGDIMDVDIPDLTGEGFPPIPSGIDVSWTFWRIRVSGSTFDQFNYRHLSALYWEAYAADAYWARFPPN